MARRSFAVIGLGRFGAATATTLVELGQDVIGIDGSEDKVREMSDALLQAVQLDATDERALRAAGIQNVDVAVISIGEDIESSLLVVMLVKELGIPTIIAKAVTPLHGRILQKLGVSRVIFPEREMAQRLAHSLVVPNVLDYIELSRDFSIVELPAPQEFVGKTLKQLQLPKKQGILVIAVRNVLKNKIQLLPPADYQFEPDSIITVIGRYADLNKLTL